MLVFERKWNKAFSAEAEQLGKDLGIAPRTALLMIARGLSDGIEAERFLRPVKEHLCDPFAFADMKKAVSRIERAIKNKERIIIFGDYDADGVCATAIMLMYLRSRGADVGFIIPSRHDEGYGMNASSPGQLKAAGAGLVITVDNGIKAAAEIAACYALGMDVIVTDHHIAGEQLPECEAIISCANDDGYPNRDICGAGLAFKLVEALGGRERAMQYVSLAGIATVADIVPMLGENRVIAGLALEAVNAGRCPAGLTALIEAAGGAGKRITSYQFGFMIAPRLNAAGRIEEAGLAVELLTQTDSARLRELAERLNELNILRREEEARIFSAACATLDADDLCDKRSIVLYDPSWNPGVVGIAAGRVAERYYRPALLLGGRDGLLTGSARSVAGVDIHAALKACERFFTRFGGHAYAAGVTLPEENLDAFREELDGYIRNNVPENAFIPRAMYDDEAELTSVTLRLAKELELFEPYGEGNERMTLRTDGVRVKSLRRWTDGKHLSLTLEKGGVFTNAVFFYRGERFDEINAMDACDVIYTPEVNNYMRESLRLNIRELRAAPPQNGREYLKRFEDKFKDAISKNIMYNSSCSYEPLERCDARALIGELTASSCSGTLALCFTPAGAARLLELAGEDGLYARMDVGFTAPKPATCAYNAALFAPVLAGLDISRYRSVVLMDTPFGMGAKLRAMAPNARFYAAVPEAGDADGLIADIALDRTRLVALYRAMQRAGQRFYNRAELLAKLARAAEVPSRQAELAAAVFGELGFIRELDGGSIEVCANAPQRQLEESATFIAMNSLGELNDNYLHLFEEADHGS